MKRYFVSLSPVNNIDARKSLFSPKKTAPKDGLLDWKTLYSELLNFFCFLFLAAQHDVGQDTEDQRAGNSGECDGAEGQHETADAGDQDDRRGEEVAVVVQIDLLDRKSTRLNSSH